MTPILNIEHISKTYQSFTLDNVSITLPKGTIMGFIGENGAGKSTTIKAILDLIKVDQGTIEVFGKKVQDDANGIKENIGVVLADSMFPENMSVKQIDKVMQNVYKQWNSSSFISQCNAFCLPLNQRNKEFSKGMKMKLSIACALSHNPKLLILDEATSGLDPIVRDEILEVFLDFIQDEEHSVLISSHITSDIEKVADFVTFIHQGKIILSEEKDELLENYAILRATDEQFQALDNDDYISYRKAKYAMDILVKNRSDIKRRFPEAILDNATLEDIMLYTVKGAHKS